MKFNLNILSANADGSHRPLSRGLYRLNKVSDSWSTHRSPPHLSEKRTQNHKKIKTFFFFKGANDRSGCDWATITVGSPRTEAAMAAFSAVVLSQTNPNFHRYIRGFFFKKGGKPSDRVIFTSTASAAIRISSIGLPRTVAGASSQPPRRWVTIRRVGVLTPPRIHHRAPGDWSGTAYSPDESAIDDALRIPPRLSSSTGKHFGKAGAIPRLVGGTAWKDVPVWRRAAGRSAVQPRRLQEPRLLGGPHLCRRTQQPDKHPWKSVAISR